MNRKLASACRQSCAFRTIHFDLDPTFFFASLYASLIFLVQVLRIRDVYPGSECFPFRIRIQEFAYFNPKYCFSALGNMICDVHPGSGF